MGIRPNVIIYYTAIVLGVYMFIIAFNIEWPELIKVLVGLVLTGIAYFTIKEGHKGVEVLFNKKSI